MDEKAPSTVNAVVSLSIEGHSLDYEVTTNLCGEVREIKCLFLELPPSAQQLIMGENWETDVAKVKAYRTLLRYFIAAQILGIRQEKDIQPLIEKIAEARQAAQLPPQRVEASELTDPWFIALDLLIKEQRANPPTGIQISLLGAVQCLFMNHPIPLKKALLNLSSNPPPLVSEVIRAWIPALPSQLRFCAYQTLKQLTSPENRSLLLAAYRDKANAKGMAFIIAGLSLYRDQEVYELLVEHASRPNLPHAQKKSLLNTLQAHHKQDPRDYAWNFVFDPHLNERAVMLLKEKGVQNEVIINYILAPLYKDNWGFYFKKIMELLASHQLFRSPHIPPPEWFFDYLVKFFVVQQHQTRGYKDTLLVSYYYLCVNRYSDALAEKLSQWAKITQSQDVQAFVFILFWRLLNQHEAHQPPTSIKAVAKAAIGTNRFALQKYAILLLRHFALQERSITVIQDLFPVLEYKHNELVETALVSINKLLEEVGFDERIVAPYQALLATQPNPKLEKLLLEGLAYADGNSP